MLGRRSRRVVWRIRLVAGFHGEPDGAARRRTGSRGSKHPVGSGHFSGLARVRVGQTVGATSASEVALVVRHLATLGLPRTLPSPCKARVNRSDPGPTRLLPRASARPCAGEAVSVKVEVDSRASANPVGTVVTDGRSLPRLYGDDGSVMTHPGGQPETTRGADRTQFGAVRLLAKRARRRNPAVGADLLGDCGP